MGFDFPDLVGSLVAGGVVGAVVGSGITALSVARRDRLADVKALRDRQAERLRTAFGPLLHAAQASLDVILSQTVLISGETEEQRDERLSALLDNAQKGLSEARVALQLEPGAGTEIEGLFRDARDAFNAYQIDLRLGKAGLHTGRDLTKLGEALESAVNRMHAEMLALLHDLAQPLPPSLGRRLRSGWRRLWHRRVPTLGHDASDANQTPPKPRGRAA